MLPGPSSKKKGKWLVDPGPIAEILRRRREGT
jgi:hypothetical protein